MFQTKILEASCVQGKGLLVNCHQSPDGLAVINTKDLLNVNNN